MVEVTEKTVLTQNTKFKETKDNRCQPWQSIYVIEKCCLGEFIQENKRQQFFVGFLQLFKQIKKNIHFCSNTKKQMTIKIFIVPCN